MASSLVLNRARKVPAEDSVAFGPIAERFRRAGDLERAISLCRDGLKRFPDQLSARVTLGWALLDLGKYDDARAELEQVLRRAPDNLAAIRGLAELHDRFEHTLNLSMDGPGQWPPPASDVDSAAPEEAIATAMEPEADAEGERPVFLNSAGAEISAPATITPAEMGVPLWTETPVVAEESVLSDGPVADPVTVAAEPVAMAAVESAAEPELDLDALIAEADSLELAASLDPATVEEPTLDLSGEVDLDALMGLAQDEALVGMGQPAAAQDTSALELGAASEEQEAETREAAELFSTAVADEPEVQGEIVRHAEPQLANPVAEFVGGEAPAATDDAAEATSTVVFLGPRTPRPASAPEPAMPEPVELEAAMAEPAMAEAVVPEPVALDAVALEETEPELIAATAAEEVAVLEPAMEPDAVALSGAAAMSEADLVAPAPNAVVIVRLERFLRRVQARRHQLMAESVA